MKLEEHLSFYGIRHFGNDNFWEWARRELGEEVAQTVDRLREPLFKEGSIPAKDWLLFYEYVAQQSISGVVNSMKADAIRVSGEAVCERISVRHKILDLGCGIGYLTTWYALRDNTRSVFGVDFSKASIQEARRKALELGVRNVDFETMDIQKSLPDDRYEAVVDTQTLYTVTNRDEVFKRIRSVLTREGLLVSIPALETEAEAGEYLDSMTNAGFFVKSFDFIHYSDCGERGAYPVIVATLFEPALVVNLGEKYQQTLAILREVKNCESRSNTQHGTGITIYGRVGYKFQTAIYYYNYAGKLISKAFSPD